MKEDRVIYYDILNILACLCVVFLHCNGNVFIFSEGMLWKFELLVQVVCYWAVPVFFMLTGAKLLKYREKYDTKTFFIKRLKSAFIPWFFWSLIFFVVYNGFSLNMFGEFFGKLLNNEILVIYWFFLALFSLYLTMPILNVFTRKKENEKYLWYMVIFSFVFNSIFPLVSDFFGFTYSSNINFSLVSNYLIFIILGYLLSNYELKSKHKAILYTAVLLSIALRYFGTIYLSQKQGSLNTLFFGYEQFHSVILAVGVFVFFKNIKWNEIIKSEKASKNITFLASMSLGVYLIHFPIMEFVSVFFIKNNIKIVGIYWDILGPLIVYIISVIIVYIIKKIPILKKLIP